MVTLLMVTSRAYAQQKNDAKRYESYKTRSVDDESASVLLDDARVLKDKDPKEALNKVQEALAISIAQKNTMDFQS